MEYEIARTKNFPKHLPSGTQTQTRMDKEVQQSCGTLKCCYILSIAIATFS